MKIRAKLIFLVMGVVALLAVAVAVAAYAILLGPINQIEHERSYLIALSDAIKDQLIELNKLPYTPFKSGYDSFSAASKEVGDAFRNLGNIKVLPRLNKGMKSAIEVIGNLQALNADRIGKLNGDADVLKGDAHQAIIHVTEGSISFDDINTYKANNPAKKPLLAAALPHFAAFMTDLAILQDSLVDSKDTIGEKYSDIDKQIGATRT